MQFAAQKSTIGRIKMVAERFSIRALSVSADLFTPRRAGRRTFDLWFTVPPRMAGTLPPEGGEPFTVHAEGTEVRGHVWGTGPTVYLVHGWGGRGSQLAAFVEPFVGSGHRVVSFDAPSHGDSPDGSVGQGRSHGLELAKALDAVFARFGPAEAVVAHSMGAIATYLALRFGWLGTRRLVLLAPMVEAETLFAQFQAALGFGPRTRRAFDREVARQVGVPLAEFDALVQASYVEPVPTLVVHDTEDRQTPYTDARRLVAGLPDARMVTTHGLGHRRILRDPQVVAEVVDFVSRAKAAAVA
jgi:pimeloyl-ACP methyl ester carboxylesterase